jgi:5-dehydro-2-deoxygluconokinase
MTDSQYDLITVGRCSMDLFSRDIGAPFPEITSFDAHIGGSPTNIAVAASRLGLRTALLTAVAPDPVGDFVLAHLAQEGVDTRFIPRKPGTRTGLAVVGVEPPARFPLVFYRDNAADLQLNIDDVAAAPLHATRALLLSGTALSRGACRDATLFAAERAHGAGVTTYLDLDLRPDQWSHPRAFGASIRSLLPLVDVIIGTEEEVCAALGPDPEAVFAGRPLNDEQKDVLEEIVAQFLSSGNGKTLIVKRGARGASIFVGGEQVIQAAGFPVEVLNTVGAGDAFAAGLVYGRSQGWDWHASARMGNACGALVVTRHGCAAAMPTLSEVEAFVGTRGGL